MLNGTLTINKDNNKNNIENNTNGQSIKADNNLDYIYDANYSSNNEYIEFKRSGPDNKNITEKN